MHDCVNLWLEAELVTTVASWLPRSELFQAQFRVELGFHISFSWANLCLIDEIKFSPLIHHYNVQFTYFHHFHYNAIHQFGQIRHFTQFCIYNSFDIFPGFNNLTHS